MLVLSRRLSEKIYIGDDIVITVVEITSNNRIRLGISAPSDVPIFREELYKQQNDKAEADNRLAAAATGLALHAREHKERQLAGADEHGRLPSGGIMLTKASFEALIDLLGCRCTVDDPFGIIALCEAAEELGKVLTTEQSLDFETKI